MGIIVRNISYYCCYKRLASVAIVVICILYCTPLSGFSMEGNATEYHLLIDQILDHAEMGNGSNVVQDFDQIEKSANESQDPRASGRKFLNSFIQEINTRYGLALTFQDACRLIRENIYNLQVSVEEMNLILGSVALIESDFTQDDDFGELVQQNGWYWPTEWNWFGLNKKDKDKHKHEDKPGEQKTVASSAPLTQTDLPGNCYMGACEMFVGALVWLIPFPGTSVLASIMIGDGVRRVADGLVQLSDERREDPNFVEPKPPF